MNERGLTLVELMVALAIAAVVLLTVQGVFIGASEVSQELRAEGKVFHRSRVFFDRLERELGSTLFSSGHPYARFTVEEAPEGRLEFSTFASTPDPSGLARGATMVQYRWRAARDGDGLELFRNERMLQQADNADAEQLLMAGLERVELRCFDGQSWETNWDSAQTSKQPRLVELFLEVQDGEHSIPFRTVFEVSGGSGS